ncbi:hypothetical protein [Pseudaminobacter sp. NGMCC 1.201702]|uniref:hypothetical protein n=1 Tax=Pseudaminobacter sp. NGMCC 1.201702 TaxID=3391825 RepID=UPI0039EF85DB
MSYPGNGAIEHAGINSVPFTASLFFQRLKRRRTHDTHGTQALWRKALRPLTHGTPHVTPRHPELNFVFHFPASGQKSCQL